MIQLHKESNRPSFEETEPIKTIKMETDIKFWNETVRMLRKGETRVDLSFNYVETFAFLQANGFFNYPGENGKYQLIRVENYKVTSVDVFIIRNFIKDYLIKINRLDVLDMIMRGGSMYLSADKLSYLDCYNPSMQSKDLQP